MIGRAGWHGPRRLAAALGLVACACAPATPPVAPLETREPKSAPQRVQTTEPEEALRRPFVGSQRVLDAPPLDVAMAEVARVGGNLSVVVELPDDWQALIEGFVRQTLGGGEPTDPTAAASCCAVQAAHVHDPVANVEFLLTNDSDPTPAQFKSSVGPPMPRSRLWLLTQESELSRLHPTLFVSTGLRWDDVLVRIPLRVSGSTPAARGDGTAAWGRALSRFLRYQGSPMQGFAVNRLAAVFGHPGAFSSELFVPGDQGLRFRRDRELDQLMSLSSGVRSIELALSRRTTLDWQGERWQPRVPLGTLRAPETPRHSWDTMLGALPASAPVPPIAEKVPADFYFMHASSGAALFTALEELDTLITPAVHLFEQRQYRYRLSERYQTELGIERSFAARVLGPSAIAELALVGSDPFLRLGSDLTLIFKPSERQLLRVGLETALDRTRERVGPLSERKLTVRGREVTHHRSDTGRVQRFSVEDEGYVIVSNSLGAITRVLETADKQTRSLAAESDFRYMLSRDRDKKADVLVYAGERFIAANVTPRARVLEARRSLAAAELRKVGYAGLVNGLFGRSIHAPAPELLKTKLLKPQELKHFDGERIEIGPIGPKSAWGRPERMVSLIDLPSPTLVSGDEQQAYERFAQTYAQLWGDALDPIALRLDLVAGKPGFNAHLRVLPLARDHGYRQVLDLVGDKRLELGASSHGIRMALGVAEDSSVRGTAEGLLSFMGGAALSLDWLGSFAFVGLEDRPSAANAVFELFAPDPRVSSQDWLEEVMRLPAYAGVHVKSAAATRLALGQVQRLVAAVFPELRWSKEETYRGVPITSIRLPTMGVTLFYALSDRLLLVAFQKATLKRLLNGEVPIEIKESATGSAQFALESAQEPGAGIATLLSWLFERADTDQGTATLAQILAMAVEGQPGQTSSGGLGADVEQVAFEVLGAAPVTRDGLPFQYTELGAEDLARGNRLIRRWPALPVAGSEAAQVLGRLRFARFALGFDTEPPGADGRPTQSLSVGIRMESEAASALSP